MNLYMGSTQISASRTASEIAELLVKSGATQINQEYSGQKLTGLRWVMKIEGGDRVFAMPARVEPVFKILQKQRAVRNRWRNEAYDRQQAERVAWRQLLRWAQAQIALIETGMVEASEVFLPYMHVAPGQTLFEAVRDSGLRLLPAPAERESQ